MDIRTWRDLAFGADAVKGYDLFITQPRRRDQVPCRVCGALCNEQRDVYAPAEPVSDAEPQLMLHDRFECPHRGADWHLHARRLVLEVESTPSAEIKARLWDELEAILRHQGMPRRPQNGGA